MSSQKITENQKEIQIGNCRICLLNKSNCTDCPLNWALDVLDIEKTLKVIEISAADLAQLNIEYVLKISPAFAEIYDPR